ncbi:hypothetical protein GCM10017774_41940 [Lentzea cavernae]|uniref:Short chain dehydrogenase n=2 Tax=Lentzea cavernae TaxID=2020703 RepID=A0ABQ3MHB2_9PSEU|nr:hypothetical protein GCM10017774_41940 [Lentzea cavernae]
MGRRVEVLGKAANRISGQVSTLVADLSEPDQAEQVTKRHAEQFGRVDVLVTSVEIGASSEQTGGVGGAAWH